MTENLEFWLNAVIPPLLLLMGLIGNFLGLRVLSSRKLEKIGPRRMYQLLFISDSFILIEILVNYLQYAYQIDVTIVSNLACKSFHFLNYSLATISPMILVYISLERYVAVKYPSKVSQFRSFRNQLQFFALIIVFNFVYYVPIPIFIGLKVNGTDTEIHEALTGCDFSNTNAKDIISYMDLVNRAVLPFTLMSFCSGMLIKQIINSRQRIQMNNFSLGERRRSQKDIKLGCTLICINVIYILFNLPYSVAVFLDDYNTNNIYIFSYYLFYSSFAINFYIILMSNSLFRKQFLIIIGANGVSSSSSIF